MYWHNRLSANADLDGIGGGDFSQHPADQLIRDLIRTGRTATFDEVKLIARHISGAPFYAASVRVTRRYRGLRFEDRILGNTENALDYHLAIRIAYGEEWGSETTRERLGARYQERLVVAYSADRGCIITGYQVNELEDLTLPEGWRWLE